MQSQLADVTQTTKYTIILLLFDKVQSSGE